MRLRVLTLLAALPWLAAGAPGGPALHAPALTVYAAASLAAAFGQLGDTLQRRVPGLTVTFNFAGSQQLALQIEQGASADVFASADQRWMSELRDSGLVVGAPQVFAHNRLVVITPAASGVRGLEDLARPGVKLVLAADAVPVGRYARQALARLSGTSGLAPDFERRVVANLVSNEENVKAVVAKVQLGEADAGVVYVSDVTPAVAPHVRQIVIPDAANVIADYPIAVVRGARAPEMARTFVALVLSPTGQSVLRSNGLIPAGAN